MVVISLLAVTSGLIGHPRLKPDEVDLTHSATLLARSIAYHDPGGRWGQTPLALGFEETRPDGSARHTSVVLDPVHQRFEWSSQRGEDLLQGSLNEGECTVTLNGSATFSAAQRDTYSLDCDRVTLYRDYYSYLWGLPMKLRDPGTRLDPEVRDTEFNRQQVKSIRVTYDQEVGSDTWYFYFDPESARLVGYRFFHDQAANDGEYIFLQGELKAEGLRLPMSRTWYTNAEDQLLGTDTLVELVAEAE